MIHLQQCNTQCGKTKICSVKVYAQTQRLEKKEGNPLVQTNSKVTSNVLAYKSFWPINT